MAVDPRRLSPGELGALLNSTTLGDTIKPAQLTRLRQLAGWRIGQGKHIDLLLWIVWCHKRLVERELETAKDDATGVPDEERGQRHRERMADRSRKAHAARAEIGEIRPPKDPERRARCMEGPDALRQFLVTYFPSTFKFPFSEDHESYIRQLQDTLEHGGRDLRVVYRGFGKTAILEGAMIWGAVKHIRRCLLLLGADDTAARDSLESIKTELETNELLLEDFPEVCVPIVALGGKPQGAPSQTCCGHRTHLRWMQDRVVLPTVTVQWNGTVERVGGGIIFCKGFPSCRRGLAHKTTRGERIRPDFVAIDDGQTDDGARSPYICAKLIEKLYRTILKLGGHQSTLSVFISGTIIRPGDFMQQLCDPEQHPSWRANVARMVYAWSKAHDTHWLSKYAEIRRAWNRDDPLDRRRAWKRAREYYAAHREEMDAGAKVAWDFCFSPDVEEISAVQHAYNMLIDDGFAAFAAECQSDPEEAVEDTPLTTSYLVARRSGHGRTLVPRDVTDITAFIDVHSKILAWIVVGWSQDFSGYVLDWGTWPDQEHHYWSKQDAKKTLRRHYKTTEAGAIVLGLNELSKLLVEKRYPRFGGGTHAIRICAVDSGWNTKAIYRWHTQSPFRAQMLPYKGKGILAKERPIAEWRVDTGDRLGDEWIITAPGKSNRPCPLLIADVNEWKTRAYQGLMIPVQSPEAIVLPDAEAGALQLIADHWCSERQDRVQVADRVKVEWTLPPSRPDNELWDCLVGAMVLASVCGISAPGARIAKPKARVRRRAKQRVSYF